MAPDYTVQTVDVYRRFAVQILETNTNGVDLLRSVQHGDELDEDWPSWVPQWEQVHTNTLAPADMVPLTISLNILSLKPTVKLRGLFISDITSRFNTRTKSSSAGFVDEPELIQLLYNPMSLRKLCWTLTAGKNWYGFSVPGHETVVTHLNDFIAYVFATYPEQKKRLTLWCAGGGQAQRFVHAASNACDGRRVFRMANGMIGLGSAALRVGDKVVELGEAVEFQQRGQGVMRTVMVGGAFVVRPSSGGRYRLVGECYVDYLPQEVGQGKTWADIELY
jgi:hypothetical protein